MTAGRRAIPACPADRERLPPQAVARIRRIGRRFVTDAPSRHRSPRRCRRVFGAARVTTVPALLVAIALWCAPTLAFALGGASRGAPRHVVILNATDPYLPAFLALDSALREAIHARSREPVDLYAETLDMSRFPQPLLENEVVTLLRTKFRGFKVDVVVADASIALDFAERHRADIWPGATIVFDSVPEALLAARDLGADTIGVPVRLEFGETIDLALKLRPGTRQIAVVAGTAEPDLRNQALAQSALARFKGKLEIRYLAGLSLGETLAAVRALPEDAVVLYLTMFRDGSGGPHVPRNVLERIAAVSPVPVFGAFETYLGHGMVAGAITSLAEQGRATGELVADVLNGKNPAAIGVQAPVAPGCMADWTQLERWRIDPGLLPADCEVRFRKVTAWDRYRWQIAAAFTVILAQAGLIVALAFNRRRLRLAQGELRDEFARRGQAESLAARLRARLTRFGRERGLGAVATAISHEINQPLIAIQNYAQAAKRRLQGDAGDKDKVMELFAKIEAQAERAGEITKHVRSLVGTSQAKLARVRLLPLLDEVIRLMEPEIESRGCRITCEPAPGLPAVLADSLEIQLVLVNLLRNSMDSVCSSDRYDKGVAIDIKSTDDRQVQVSVVDRGRGVAADQVAEIFEPLASGKSGGMGVGLAISRAIIEAHGGRLWYETNPAGGAIFRFTLRTAGSEEP
jgi:signal transduction histidine kinase